jgi:hypothetical protein
MVARIGVQFPRWFRVGRKISAVLNHSIDQANKHTGTWTADEDRKLKDAVQMHGGKDWGIIAPLVPGRTNKQCRQRWKDVLDPSIDRANEQTDKWTAVEDSKLKDAVQTHNGKNWIAIAAYVPGRTQKQCWVRWRVVLDPNTDRASGRKGTWTEDEDSKLKDAVQTHGGKNWGAISALVPGRTKIQCWNRWHNVLNPSIALTSRREGTWTEDEDSKLKDAVQTHGGKNWGAIAVLVPGRTGKQCWNRWHNAVNPSIALMDGREGKWTEEEDSKLKDAVETHGGKNWGAIAALVPGRTKGQCVHRWNVVLDPNIDRASGRTGKWAEDEDNELRDAVQRHGSKDWSAIAALVPGRTKGQCNQRWRDVLDPSIDQASVHRRKWTAVEDSKLKDAVQTHGGKNWGAVAALVSSRTKSQCRRRWKDVLDPTRL